VVSLSAAAAAAAAAAVQDGAIKLLLIVNPLWKVRAYACHMLLSPLNWRACNWCAHHTWQMFQHQLLQYVVHVD
jgi:hypothetical protein